MVDLFFRTLYRVAYRVMRVYWAVLRPRTHGAIVAVWSGGEVLLVHSSYAPYVSFPGGYVKRGERGLDAARRELEEEVGIRIEPSALVPLFDEEHSWEGKRDRVEVFALELAQPPAIAIDRREVVGAGFYTPARALELKLFPPARQAIERRLGRA